MLTPFQTSLVALSKRIALQRTPLLTSISTYATKASPKKKDNSNDNQQVFDPRYIGLTGDSYIPLSWGNIPNPLKSPKLAWNCLIRKIYTVGFNTIQIGLLRYQTGLKPKFLLWKNNSIENYVRVNKGFASKKVSSISNEVSIWVEQALKARVDTIPKNVTLDWKLVKFNKPPKLITFRPIMLPGKPIEYIQIIYRFNTNQQLIKINQKDDKVSKLSRDVVDYVGFIIDIHDNKAIMAGSIFENSPYDRIPKPEDQDKTRVFNDMRVNGDIFRVPPPTKPSNSTITSKE